MFSRQLKSLILAAVLALSSGQQGYEDYQDYSYGDEQDNLYADYAMKQQVKAEGGGGPSLMKLVMFGATGWIAGAKISCGKAIKAFKKKSQKEAKTLYSQYYNDVYKLQEHNAELVQAIQQLQKMLQETETSRELESMQRDYDEFKQPDVDGDDRISRAEFNMYVKNYLSNYPGLTEKDYPRFDDFDHDRDGYVSFAEYSKQMKIQAEKAARDAQKAAQAGNQAAAQRAGAKAHAYSGLSGQGGNNRAASFDDLYAQYR
jgi:hypothetical protein